MSDALGIAFVMAVLLAAWFLMVFGTVRAVRAMKPQGWHPAQVGILAVLVFLLLFAGGWLFYGTYLVGNGVARLLRQLTTQSEAPPAEAS